MAMHLLSTVTAGYLTPFRVTVQSLADHLPEALPTTWHVCGQGLSEDDRRTVAGHAQDTALEFAWYELSPEVTENLPVRGHFVPHVYSRLLAPDLLPESVDRFIYLDCDLLVMDSIETLWRSDLEGRTVAAVQDMAVPRISSPMGIRHYADLGLDAGELYFNAGVYVVDRAAWRGREVRARALHYIESYRHSLNLLDQDAINAVLCGDWKKLHYRWNLIASLAGRRHFKTQGLDRERYEEALDNPAIVHFAGLLKPWRQPRIAAFASKDYVETLRETVPEHRLDRSLKSRSFGFYDRRLRRLAYPIESFIWQQKRGF